MVQRDPNAEPSEMNHREPVVCSTAHAVACQLMRGSPRRQANASGTRFGTISGLFAPNPALWRHMFSFREGGQRPRDRETLYFAG
jgi:hypothetical protein